MASHEVTAFEARHLMTGRQQGTHADQAVILPFPATVHFVKGSRMCEDHCLVPQVNAAHVREDQCRNWSLFSPMIVTSPAAKNARGKSDMSSP